MTTAIKVENLSKLYRLGEIGTGTISKDIERWVARLRSKEDPFLKIGQTNDRTTKGDSNIVYSLQDINFDIQQGDAVGIIGRNGAGKSTLLKILSRVTSPTTGKIHIKGRVASLLEVGTGFHPELTGRENIYLNGAILGMRKKEIARKLDEIIDFSGVERYIDTPVKRYSSGMYVRLAFAVAAHLESEILIVDEVLAVGDAEFQKKCLGKMSDVSKGDGRTVLFVSHNMNAIENLCKNAILLSNGSIKLNASSKSVITEYITTSSSTKSNWDSKHEANPTLIISHITSFNEEKTDTLWVNQNVIIQIQFTTLIDCAGIAFELFVKDLSELIIFSTYTNTMSFKKGNHTIECIIPQNTLNDIQYNITVAVSQNYSVFILKIENAIAIQLNNNTAGLGWQGDWPGVMRPQTNWKLLNHD